MNTYLYHPVLPINLLKVSLPDFLFVKSETKHMNRIYVSFNTKHKTLMVLSGPMRFHQMYIVLHFG